MKRGVIVRNPMLTRETFAILHFLGEAERVYTLCLSQIP